MYVLHPSGLFLDLVNTRSNQRFSEPTLTVTDQLHVWYRHEAHAEFTLLRDESAYFCNVVRTYVRILQVFVFSRIVKQRRQP